jgi:hypothetical protein
MYIPVFFLERTDLVQVRLRRYRSERPVRADPIGKGRWLGCMCDESAVIGLATPASEWMLNGLSAWAGEAPDLVPRDDFRWPKRCAACDRPFSADDRWQINVETLFEGAPLARLYTRRNAPPGAMWDMDWLHEIPQYVGSDGIALAVRTPGGDWYVDGQASNCTRPGEPHKCWVRHGDPRDPQGLKGGVKLHVDKAGDTCAAGAGSIIAGSFHGFLHHGSLVSC